VSTYAAFRGHDPLLVTSIRLLSGYVIAVIAGGLVLRCNPTSILRPGILQQHDHDNSADGTTSKINKFKKALLTSTTDFIDVACYLVIGATVASLFNTGFDQVRITSLATQPLLAIPSMMGLASLLSLCSSSDAFVAASFFTFPLASKWAFMIFGPMVDLKLIFLYSSIFQKRFILLLVTGLIFGVALLCCLLDRFYA
jgi:uncharacterized protein